MQTFLPYEDFRLSAQVLDYRRLGKQRVECKQILKAIYTGGGWRNHPATKMWIGYEPALCLYYNEIVREWIYRGYKNNMPLINLQETHIKFPPWLGNSLLHRSHRSNLLRKDPEYYGQHFHDVTPDLGYVWPVRNT